MDATLSKVDKIDPHFYINSDRVSISEETRIKATSEEATQYAEANRDPKGNFCSLCSYTCILTLELNHIFVANPNFISNIFFLTISMAHYGYLRTIQSYNALAKHLEDIQRHLDFLQGDGSWMGVSL